MVNRDRKAFPTYSAAKEFIDAKEKWAEANAGYMEGYYRGPFYDADERAWIVEVEEYKG